MSMDLFLEMARKQLDLLLNPTFLASEPVPVPRQIPLPLPSTSALSVGGAAVDSTHHAPDDSTSKQNLEQQDAVPLQAGALDD